MRDQSVQAVHEPVEGSKLRIHRGVYAGKVGVVRGPYADPVRPAGYKVVIEGVATVVFTFETMAP